MDESWGFLLVDKIFLSGLKNVLRLHCLVLYVSLRLTYSTYSECTQRPAFEEASEEVDSTIQ